jgi:hypothetical protein
MEDSTTVTLYFDACCLNRPFDDQTQARIRLESEAFLIILARCEYGDWAWIGSQVLDWEIEQTPDPERRRRVQLLASYAQHSVSVGPAEVERAETLELLGFAGLDALHLACAESGSADVFLTTDDRLLHRAAAYASDLHVRAANPLTWLEEVSD